MLKPLLFGSLLLTLCLGACAGELEDPERFTGAVGGGCEPGDEPAFLAETCGVAFCHAAENPAGELDLASPGVAARLVDVASTCDGTPLVDSADPGASLLLDKLEAQPSCGDPMPPGRPLSAADRSCIDQWVESL